MRIAFIALLLTFASSSFGQVIYEPVRFQYGGQNPYYYGGSDPRVHVYANQPRSEGAQWGRVNGFEFVSANIHTHREVNAHRPRVFTDAIPFQDAHYFGFTVNDARNEANANAPLYVRKRDLLRSAVPQGRVWVVPASAGAIDEVNGAQPRLTPRAATDPKPVIIVPKRVLERKNPIRVVKAES